MSSLLSHTKILGVSHGAPHGQQPKSRIADGEFRSARRCPAIVLADASGTKELGGIDSPQVRARCGIMCTGGISHYSLQQRMQVAGVEIELALVHTEWRAG